MALGGIGSPIGRLIGDPPLFLTNTLSAVVGSFVLTGEAATFRTDFVCADGTFALTGEPAALTRSYPSSVGSFVLTGEGASFEIEFNLNAVYPSAPAGIGSPIGRHIGGAADLNAQTIGLFELTGKDAPLTPAIVADTAGFVISSSDVTFTIPPNIIGTDDVQLPINCILAGQQLIRDRYRKNEVFKPRLRATEVVSRGRGGRLKGGKPSFTVTTNKRGYD